jgi:hypothetical protein
VRLNNKLVPIAVGFAVLAASNDASAENGKIRAHRRHHHATKPSGCPIYKNAEGELVDCRGWRKRKNATGWDNTCLNLPYLPSIYACGSVNGNGGW